MGLDFSHCDASWAYSGFNRFRTRLAACIGIELDKMEGFGGIISWSTVKNPLVPFLYHSDCDGHLTPKQCKQIAPVIRQLVKYWPDGDYDKEKALELVRGMASAARCKQNLEFK